MNETNPAKPVDVNEAAARVAEARGHVSDAYTMLANTAWQLDTMGLDQWEQQTVRSALAELNDELTQSKATGTIHLNDGSLEADVVTRLRKVAHTARLADDLLTAAADRLQGVSAGMNEHYKDDGGGVCECHTGDCACYDTEGEAA